MPLDHAALLGPAGEVLVEWDLGEPLDPTRLDVTHPLPDGIPWVLAMAWSERTSPPLQDVPAWAVTTAIFLERP
jgi:hypothetical protein